MHGNIVMKLVTVNHWQVHVTMMTLRKSTTLSLTVSQKKKLCSRLSSSEVRF